MAVALGILVAMGFGSADFLGGRASRSAPTITVLFLAQAVALAGAVIAALVVNADITSRDLLLGVGAGTCNAVGLGLLYQGLATGRMGVVAPVTAVVGALVPIVWGLATGERPSALTWLGVALAVGAGGLVAREPNDTDARGDVRSAILLAIVAGITFGSSFVLYAETSDGSGMWPMFSARVAAIVVVGVGVALLTTRGPVRWPAGVARTFALTAGVLDIIATTLLLVAVREGLTVVVAPVAALAPAFTVVGAWVFLHERVTRHQVVGLAIALTGLVLIAAG